MPLSLLCFHIRVPGKCSRLVLSEYPSVQCCAGTGALFAKKKETVNDLDVLVAMASTHLNILESRKTSNCQSSMGSADTGTEKSKNVGRVGNMTTEIIECKMVLLPAYIVAIKLIVILVCCWLLCSLL